MTEKRKALLERVAENKKRKQQEREEERRRLIEAGRKRKELLKTIHNIDKFYEDLTALCLKHQVILNCGCEYEDPYIQTLDEVQKEELSRGRKVSKEEIVEQMINDYKG